MTIAASRLLRTPHDLVRRQAALALRARVAGDAPTDRADRIWGAVGPRWFAPQDPIWRVHLNASMFVGGLRALMLQALHPLAMAGVEEHSTYRDDPWARLQQTSGFISQTTFGTIADSERLIARVRGVHRRVRGTFEGVPYAASDPELLRWVHLAEADSFLATYRAFARERLTPAEEGQYVAQIGSISMQLGFTGAPQTVADMDTQLTQYRPVLRATPAALSVPRFLMSPRMPLAARPGYLSLVAGAIATLPDYARRMLQLPVPDVGVPALRVAGLVGARSIEWILSDPLIQHDRRISGESSQSG